MQKENEIVVTIPYSALDELKCDTDFHRHLYNAALIADQHDATTACEIGWRRSAKVRIKRN
jgi:hypothetical protein